MNTFVLTHLLSLLQLLTQSTSSDGIRAEHNRKVKNVGNKPPYLTGSKPTHKGSEHSATFFCKRNLEFSIQLWKSFPSLLVLQLDVLHREIWKGGKSCIGASAPTGWYWHTVSRKHVPVLVPLLRLQMTPENSNHVVFLLEEITEASLVTSN